MLNSISGNRIKRGEVSAEFVEPFRNRSVESLTELLASSNAQERTSVAMILGERQCESAIEPLCQALSIEGALYSRLAICEALIAIGLPAIVSVIELLGKIGINQHKALPQKGFYKKSYPLPRDIAARTLIRMGTPVLECLAFVLTDGTRNQKLEALDVIGHISFQHKVTHSLRFLLELYFQNQDDPLLQWKIIRVFQAFPEEEVTDLLIGVAISKTEPALRWEAVRSLSMQKRKINPQLIENLRIDSDAEVRQLMDLFF
ncbi:MAG: hypothetical protein JEZ00_07020 [Anaerolineaceae bacterium]|nr:hypothetical protein [Anaerolineaceae bacterium]